MIPHPDREDQQCHWKVWEELEPESEIMVKTSSSGKLYQCSVERTEEKMTHGQAGAVPTQEVDEEGHVADEESQIPQFS